jgi:glycosyltransferase involved in cell wall biosynthesis
MHVAVVICTWNRASLLDQTLTRLSALRVPAGVHWDLLVVNNNCTDETDAVLARHAGLLPLRRLFEPRPGKSYAANLAIASTPAELLLWTDDDVWVHPDWLCAYVSAAQAWPDAGFFGGTVEPLFAVEPPPWIRHSLHLLTAPFVIVDLGPTVRPLQPDEIPFGANMAMRREALQRERFNGRLGPCEDTQIRGEESELIARLRSNGQSGVWVGPARVRHFIPPERLTRRYLWSYYRGLGRTDARLNGCGTSRLLGGAPRWAVRQYLTAKLAMTCLAPRKGRRWVQALRTAAKMRGIIGESRRLCREARCAEIGYDLNYAPSLARVRQPTPQRVE